MGNEAESGTVLARWPVAQVVSTTRIPARGTGAAAQGRLLTASFLPCPPSRWSGPEVQVTLPLVSSFQRCHHLEPCVGTGWKADAKLSLASQPCRAPHPLCLPEPSAASLLQLQSPAYNRRPWRGEETTHLPEKGQRGFRLWPARPEERGRHCTLAAGGRLLICWPRIDPTVETGGRTPHWASIRCLQVQSVGLTVGSSSKSQSTGCMRAKPRWSTASVPDEPGRSPLSSPH